LSDTQNRIKEDEVMKQKRLAAEQFVNKLRQAEVAMILPAPLLYQRQKR
jgi:hypothetical protein